MQFDLPLIPLQLTRSCHNGETRVNLNWFTNRGSGLAERRTTLGAHFYSDQLAERLGTKDPETAVTINGKIYHDVVVRKGDKVIHRVTAQQIHAAEELKALREELDRQARESEAALQREPAMASAATLKSELYAHD